jgi:hypothetical protein
MANLRFTRIQLESQEENSTPEIEEWRDIKDYPGYQVSNHGRVRSFWTMGRRKNIILDQPQRILKMKTVPKRYLVICKVSASGKRKGKAVHRLVLETFGLPQPKGAECRHLDGNLHNNKITNLAWGTRSDNMADAIRHGTFSHGETHPHSKLTNAQVLEIREKYDQGSSSRQLAHKFGVDQGHILYIVTGAKRKDVGGPTHQRGSDFLSQAVKCNDPELSHTKLNENLVAQILVRIRNNEKQSVLAKEFNVSTCTISQIAKRKIWKHVFDGKERIYNGRAKSSRTVVNEELVILIRQRHANGETVTGLSQSLKINVSTIDHIVKRRSWKYI